MSNTNEMVSRYCKEKYDNDNPDRNREIEKCLSKDQGCFHTHGDDP